MNIDLNTILAQEKCVVLVDGRGQQHPFVISHPQSTYVFTISKEQLQVELRKQSEVVHPEVDDSSYLVHCPDCGILCVDVEEQWCCVCHLAQTLEDLCRDDPPPSLSVCDDSDSWLNSDTLSSCLDRSPTPGPPSPYYFADDEDIQSKTLSSFYSLIQSCTKEDLDILYELFKGFTTSTLVTSVDFIHFFESFVSHRRALKLTMLVLDFKPLCMAEVDYYRKNGTFVPKFREVQMDVKPPRTGISMFYKMVDEMSMPQIRDLHEAATDDFMVPVQNRRFITEFMSTVETGFRVDLMAEIVHENLPFCIAQLDFYMEEGYFIPELDNVQGSVISGETMTNIVWFEKTVAFIHIIRKCQTVPDYMAVLALALPDYSIKWSQEQLLELLMTFGIDETVAGSDLEEESYHFDGETAVLLGSIQVTSNFEAVIKRLAAWCGKSGIVFGGLFSRLFALVSYLSLSSFMDKVSLPVASFFQLFSAFFEKANVLTEPLHLFVDFISYIFRTMFSPDMTFEEKWNELLFGNTESQMMVKSLEMLNFTDFSKYPGDGNMSHSDWLLELDALVVYWRKGALRSKSLPDKDVSIILDRLIRVVAEERKKVAAGSYRRVPFWCHVSGDSGTGKSSQVTRLATVIVRHAGRDDSAIYTTTPQRKHYGAAFGARTLAIINHDIDTAVPNPASQGDHPLIAACQLVDSTAFEASRASLSEKADSAFTGIFVGTTMNGDAIDLKGVMANCNKFNRRLASSWDASWNRKVMDRIYPEYAGVPYPAEFAKNLEVGALPIEYQDRAVIYTETLGTSSGNCFRTAIKAGGRRFYSANAWCRAVFEDFKKYKAKADVDFARKVDEMGCCLRLPLGMHTDGADCASGCDFRANYSDPMPEGMAPLSWHPDLYQGPDMFKKDAYPKDVPSLGEWFKKPIKLCVDNFKPAYWTSTREAWFECSSMLSSMCPCGNNLNHHFCKINGFSKCPEVCSNWIMDTLPFWDLVLHPWFKGAISGYGVHALGRFDPLTWHYLREPEQFKRDLADKVPCFSCYFRKLDSRLKRELLSEGKEVQSNELIVAFFCIPVLCLMYKKIEEQLVVETMRRVPLTHVLPDRVLMSIYRSRAQFDKSEIKKHYLKLAAGSAMVLGAIMVYKMTRKDLFQVQMNNRVIPLASAEDINKAESERKEFMFKFVPVPAREWRSRQNFIQYSPANFSTSARDLENLVKANMCTVSSNYGSLHGVFVSPGILMVPRHCLRDNQARNDSLVVELDHPGVGKKLVWMPDYSRCEQVGDSDSYLFHVPDFPFLGGGSSLIKHFADEYTQGLVVEGKLIGYDEVVMARYSPVVAPSSHYLGKAPKQCVLYDLDTKNGDCGRIFMGLNSGKGCLLASHILGDASMKAASVLIKQSDLVTALNRLVASGARIYAPPSFAREEATLLEQVQQRGLHMNSPLWKLPGLACPVGSEGPSKSTQVSKLRKTALCPRFECFLSEPYTGPYFGRVMVVDGEHTSGMLRKLKQLQRVAYCVPQELMNFAKADYMFGAPPGSGKPLPLEVAWNGIDGDKYYKPFAEDTSSGPPWNWKGLTPKAKLFKDELLDPTFKESLYALAARLRCAPVWTTVQQALKDEAIAWSKFMKGRARVYGVMGCHLNLLGRAYYLPIIRWLCENMGWSGVYISANILTMDWDELFKTVTGAGWRAFDADLVGMDNAHALGMAEAIAALSMEIGLHIGYSEEDALTTYHLGISLFYQMIVNDKDWYLSWNGLPSGAWFTIVFNCLSQCLLYRCIYYRITGAPLGDYRKHVKEAFVGDDTVVGVGPERQGVFNQKIVIEQAALLNYELTPAHKEEAAVDFVAPDKLMFLKRTFKDDKRVGAIVAPLALDSVYKQLCYEMEDIAIPPPVRLVQVAQNAQREMWLHGDEEFQTLTTRLCLAFAELKIPFEPLKATDLQEVYLSGKFQTWDA